MNRFELGLDESAGAGRRHFDLQQANRAIVLVRRVVADIVEQYHRLVELQETFDAGARPGCAEGSGDVQGQMVAIAEKIESCTEELDELGVELRDWAEGVVDFPCIADGREVYLCWRHGEESVEYWHEAQAGSESRKPIATLPQERPLAAPTWRQ